MGIEKPGQRLTAFTDLSGDEFIAEVRKRRPKGSPRLTPAAIMELNGTRQHYADPECRRAAEILVLERRLSDLAALAAPLHGTRGADNESLIGFALGNAIAHGVRPIRTLSAGVAPSRRRNACYRGEAPLPRQ